MTLHPPFEISARLLPAIRIGSDTLSHAIERGAIVFYLDCADGTEFCITGLRDPACGRASVVSRFEGMLSALGAAVDAYRYRVGRGEPYEDSNETMFEPAVTEWACQNSSEIERAWLDIENEDSSPREELIS